MMKIANKYTILLLWLVSSLSFAQAQEDCLSIQDDYVSLIESGKYRFANEVESESIASINFKKLANYQQYLESAYQVVVNNNPRANMPLSLIHI